MGRRSRRFVLATVAVIAAVVASRSRGAADGTQGGTGGQTTETKEPYKIGAVLSLTGTYAGLGEPEKNTLSRWRSRASTTAGGVNGHPIEVVIEDDATDAAKAVAATAKLIEQDKVIAHHRRDRHAGRRWRMRGDVDKAGIPQVSMAGGTVITANFDPLVFQTPWSNKIVVPVRAGVHEGPGHHQDRPDQRLGRLRQGRHRPSFEAEAPKFGITVVADETFNPGDTDMTAQLTKIKGSDAEAVVMVTAGKEAAIVAKNMEQLKMDDAALRHPRQRAHGVHQGAGTAAEGFTLRGRQDPHPRGLRDGDRELQGRDRLHRPVHRQVRQGAQTRSRAMRTTRSTSSSRP